MTNNNISSKADIQTIKLHVINSPTIMQRAIQIVKRRRINICQFIAQEDESEKGDGTITMILKTDSMQARLLKTQFEKQIDVIGVL